MTFAPLRLAPAVSEPEPASTAVCAPSLSPAPSGPLPSIAISFGEQVRMTIEGAPDAATLAGVIEALTMRDRWR